MSSDILDKNAGQNGDAMVHIDGQPQDVNDAKAHVLEMISSASNRRNNDTQRGGYQREERTNNEYTQLVEIYPEKVAVIIGRGGSKIKELQSKFRVRINVDRNENQNRKIDVKISGDRSDVENAIDDVQKLTQDVDISSYSEPKRDSRPVESEIVVIDWQAAAQQCVRTIELF